MYAIIVSGGKQHRVAVDKVIKVEKLTGEVGSSIEFDKVLMVTDGDVLHAGKPYVANAKVIGEVVEHGRGEKVHIIKFRRRKHYMKRQGHRQYFTAIKINSIVM